MHCLPDCKLWSRVQNVSRKNAQSTDNPTVVEKSFLISRGDRGCISETEASVNRGPFVQPPFVSDSGTSLTNILDSVNIIFTQGFDNLVFRSCDISILHLTDVEPPISQPWAFGSATLALLIRGVTATTYMVVVSMVRSLDKSLDDSSGKARHVVNHVSRELGAERSLNDSHSHDDQVFPFDHF